MVREQLEARAVTDRALLDAFRRVPRHAFAAEHEAPTAYGDHALPLPAGQTISQPYIVAAMTSAAQPPGGWRGARVLEVGTGSGYQAAILAELGAEVVSIERHRELSRLAAEQLVANGYHGVRLLVGDGSEGAPEWAPYDAIIVTAAGPSIPQPLVDQLAPSGGRLVMPIGSRDHQLVTVVERHGSEVRTRQLEPAVFVPLIGEHGFTDE
ncbi:MAG: protein-L-isoaspartate(D-aspartate) O-methyltransferase [Chloroflexota bacterium]|nr:protein-L-isoaspartate(D-aspartate) O-methyltransferase [Chloroflexota bacterium]